MTTIEPDPASGPETNLDGRLIWAGDEDFETACTERIFNGRRPSRRPAAVLLARDEDDIVAGLRLAKSRGLQVAIRSGGHSWAAWSLRENSLLIDLEQMRHLELDEDTGIVTASPAIKGGDELDPFLEKHGRFFNGGHCPSVGIGGFLLQGGQGWCARGWGWAAESVVAIDAVTADGRQVRADAETNPDLFWAARGAGPAFPAVVTRFHLQTRPRFKHVGLSVQLYELDQFDAVMSWLYGMHESVSPDVEIVAVSMIPPPGTVEPPRRVLAVTAVALVGSQAESERVLAPFTTCPTLPQALLTVHNQPSSLAEQRLEQERNNPRHARYFTDNIWVDGDPATIIDRIRPLYTELPEDSAFSIWFSMGPTRELPDMAFSLQSSAYIATYLVSHDAENDAGNGQWLQQAMAHAQPVTVGQYLGDSDFTTRQLRFMAPEQYQRLTKVISNWDPERRFVPYLAADPGRLNANHWESGETG